MSIAVIIGLILLGVVLITVEFLIIPGITIAGIAGLILMVIANFFAYKDHGLQVGNIILLSTFLINIVIAILIFRKKTWNKIGLQTSVDGKANSSYMNVKVGDKGKSISRLAPMGKAYIKDQLYEVTSQGSFVDENKEIEVIFVKRNKIIVKQIL